MKILIADDSAFVRNVISKALKLGFPDSELIISVDGQAAYDAFIESNPDVLVTDMLMPNMTGQELLRKLKLTHPQLKAIVVSADIQNATRAELEEIGILGFVNKPLTPEKCTLLVDLIRGHGHAE